ncbi:flagellar basal-body MS-ring/collar protein FliF [Nocardioides nematodiphilus]|uniref:flagellar basal-body MS-ring/collar protein FliF n=1 Tax=Nocardioides nematodiphilus TaxID=2849669 RepID=UPI001CD9741A|nr:flagellar basal-body MS-ring/collar protein FliF [Nocardioides nematodiphilus]MCA1984246.1 flagellar M-ring protein FliF [Nocardioides nematodiphilus]
MRENLTQLLGRYRRAFSEFSNGQKAVAIVGSGALLLAAFLVFRWVSAPSYAPLYTNLSGSDASAVIDELNKEGVAYQLGDGGATIEVPQKEVYSTRIALAGQDLPAGNSTDSGYSLLDKQSLSTSDFKEQTDFKRAMEGELDNTLEAIDGVQTAVVHLAIPEKKVFSDTQDPTTASVLLSLKPGTTLSSEQVQAVVHLVAASIDGLDPNDVTVTDQLGNVLTTRDDTPEGMASTQAEATAAYNAGVQKQIQDALDPVIGVGNATYSVNSVLNFDQQTTDSLTYGKDKNPPALTQSASEENYKGAGAGTQAGGIVGPDGQMDPTTTGGANSTYNKRDSSSTNAVDQTRQKTIKGPGTLESQHIGVVLDTAALGAISPAQVKTLIANAIGINAARGDTIDVTTMPFNHAAEQAAQAQIKAAQAAADHAQRMKLIRDGGIAGVIALIILLAWIRGRRRAKAREDATSYVVEQLRADAAARAAELEEPNPAIAALEAAAAAEDEHAKSLRSELNQLVDSQPEDVASLLRGWLVERS